MQGGSEEPDLASPQVGRFLSGGRGGEPRPCEQARGETRPVPELSAEGAVLVHPFSHDGSSRSFAFF